MKTPNDDSVISYLDFSFNPLCQWETEGEGRCVVNAGGMVVCRHCRNGEYRCKRHWLQLEEAKEGKWLKCDHCNESRPFHHMVRFVPLVGGIN